MKTLLSLITVLCSFSVIAQAQAHAQPQINAVASFSILGDLVEQVCADACLVTTIVGPDADAHLYEPTMADAIAVANADILFVNGLGFETWTAALIDNSGNRAGVVDVNVNANRLLVDGVVDPHAWNDPANAKLMVREIARALSVLAPQGGADFWRNAEDFEEALDLMLIPLSQRLRGIPAQGRVVVTLHDAFGYLGRATGIRFLAPIGIDGEAEPNARELMALIEQIRATDAAALFVENVKSPELIEQIGRETGLGIGGRLYSDALSERGGPATSYLAMMEHNLGAILTELEK